MGEGIRAHNELYFDEGALLVKGLLNKEVFAPLRRKLVSEIHDFFDCYNEQDPRWIAYARQNPEVVTKVYDRMRDAPQAVSLGLSDPIRQEVQGLLGNDVRLYGKIPFRIDVPGEAKELAYWHQDDFYVKGAPNELTIWIPLQDVPAHVGALSVIKNSHRAGRIPHTLKYGKKHLPQDCFNAPINIIEMEFGDALFFNSFLLHSSNLNISDKIRYSIQLRYTSLNLGCPSNIMGELYEF